MKKLTAIVLTLFLALGAVSAFAETAAAPALIKDVAFGMSMDQVMQQMNLPNYEIDNEHTFGGLTFGELEYNHVALDEGFSGDVTFLFSENKLMAVRYDLTDGTAYDAVKDAFVRAYGEAIPFDAAKITDGRYAIDDDGELRDCKDMILTESAIVVLEQDHDGDVDVTILNPANA